MRRFAFALFALLLAACGDAKVETARCGIAPPPARPGDTSGMADIPAGVMTMGARPMQPGEGPAVRVPVAAFRIDRTDVTNAQFAAFVAAGPFADGGFAFRALVAGPLPLALFARYELAKPASRPHAAGRSD